MASVRTCCLALVCGLDVQVLEDDSQRDVPLGEALEALLGHLGIRDEAAHLCRRKLVIVNDVLVHSLETRGLEEGCAAFGRVLPAVEDGLSLLLLEDALVTRLQELRTKPIVISILLDLLQCNDVCCHGLELLEDQVLAPSPGQCPLLTVWVNRFCRIQVREDVPIHDLELFAQPLGIEGATVADHPASPRFLRRRDDGARGDRHASHERVSVVLEEGDDVEAQGSVDVLLARAVRPRGRDFDPLCNRLLHSVVVWLAPPHVLRQVVPAPQETLLGAIALERLRNVPNL
mmetsp:Transcript_87289/g.226698  ORF Transcript_87289/g.226698 Transcript_87289/m.226698 type:complete len:289 (-) Transcript_87289:431-1297(-)